MTLGPFAIAAVAMAVLGASIVSGIFGMAGGMILLGVLLLFMDVAPGMVLFGVIQIASNGGAARCGSATWTGASFRAFSPARPYHSCSWAP